MNARWKQSRMNWFFALAAMVTILGNLSCAKGGAGADDRLSTPATSQLQGGQDAGGGDVPKASRAEVDSAIANVRRDARSFLSAIQNSVERGACRSKDGELNQVLTVFFGPNAEQISHSEGIYRYPIAELIGHLTKLTWTDSAFCQDVEGKIHDASTEHTTNAKICFNEDSLRRLSPDSLKEEVLTLYFHELTHQMGFGESAAVKLQEFVREKQKSMYFVSNVRTLAVTAAASKGATDRCFFAGQIQGELSGWRGRVVDIDYSTLTAYTKNSRWYVSLGEQLRPDKTGRAGGILGAVAAEVCRRPFSDTQDKKAFLEIVNWTLDSL